MWATMTMSSHLLTASTYVSARDHSLWLPKNLAVSIDLSADSVTICGIYHTSNFHERRRSLFLEQIPGPDIRCERREYKHGMQNEWSICESSVHTETVENSEVQVRICWRQVRFSQLLLSLQVTAAERTKRTLLRGLMPCEMGIENPWIPWFPSCLACFLPSQFVIYVTSRDGNIFSTRKREYLHHCVVWSQLTSTRGARPLFCLQRKVARLFYEQQNDKQWRTGFKVRLSQSNFYIPLWSILYYETHRLASCG